MLGLILRTWSAILARATSRPAVRRRRVLAVELLGERKVFTAGLAVGDLAGAEPARVGDSAVVDLSIGLSECFAAEANDAQQSSTSTLASASIQQTDEAFASYDAEGEELPSFPAIQNFTAFEDQGGVWVITGSVSDDGPVGGLYVFFYFNGVYQDFALTNEDGSFSMALIVPEGDYGFVEAYAIDNDAMGSETVYAYVSNY